MTKPPAPSSVAVFAMGDVIGDALNKLPFMRALRAAFPQAHITWITARKSVYAHALKEIADLYVDEVRELSGIGLDAWWPFHRRPAAARRYSILIDLQPVFWRTLDVRRLPHDVFISSTANYFFSDVKPPKGWVRPEHMTDRLLEFVRLAAGEVPALGPADLVKPEIAAKAARALPAGPTYVGFAPGGGRAFQALAARALHRRGARSGGEGPRARLHHRAERARSHARDSHRSAGRTFPEQMDEIWAGAFSPLNTIALGQRLTAALANDSGLAHMLAAADAPMLTLFGRTNALKFRPRSRRGEVMTAASFGGEALADIPVAPVVAALEAIVAVAAAAPTPTPTPTPTPAPAGA